MIDPKLTPLESDSVGRLKVLEYQMSVLLRNDEKGDEKAADRHKELSAQIEKITSNIRDMQSSHSNLSTETMHFREDVLHDIKEIRDDVVTLTIKIEQKVAVVWFKDLWKTILGIGVLIAALSGLIQIALNLHWIR